MFVLIPNWESKPPKHAPFLGHHRRFHVTHLFWKTKTTFCIGMLNFTCRPFFLKFRKGYQIQRKPFQEEEGGEGVKEEKRPVEPVASQREEGLLLRINSVTRGCAGDMCALFALARAGQEVSGLLSPAMLSGPNHPVPRSKLPAACSLSPGAVLRLPELDPKGTVSRLPRAATPAGSAPHKQRIQLGAPAAGLLRRAEGARVSD